MDSPCTKLFVQLNRLSLDGKGQGGWHEAGRWIQNEEVFDEATRRWRKRRVASLSFDTLLKLHHYFATDCLLLEVRPGTFASIALRMVEGLETSQHLNSVEGKALLDALLLSHTTPNVSNGTKFAPLAFNSFRTTLDSWHRLYNHNIQQPGQRYRSFSGLETRSRFLQTFSRSEAALVLIGCVSFLSHPVMVLVRLGQGCHFPALIEVPIPLRFLFLFMGPMDANLDYDEAGRCMAALLADQTFQLAAYKVSNQKDLTAALVEFLDYSLLLSSGLEARSEVLYPVYNPRRALQHKYQEPAENPEALTDVKVIPAVLTRPFGGLLRDVARCYPKYLSSLRNGLSIQCVAVSIFVYFAALSSSITFGGLLADKTKNMIGVSELIMSTALQGLVMAFLSAQPLLIVGFTGPLLVFEEAFFTFCKDQGVDYLTARVWIGLWLALIAVVSVGMEGSILVRFISRFTQEIFSLFISIIFIYETFAKLHQIFQNHPLLPSYSFTSGKVPNLTSATNSTPALGATPQPNTALLSTALTVGTFCLALYLCSFKNSHFLPGKMRRLVGDFGVPIAILFMVFISKAAPNTFLQKLEVPTGFQLTDSGIRGWFIDPRGRRDKNFPLWMMMAAIIPAFLVFILIFIETQITALIVSKSSRPFVKGSGIHLDLLLLALMGGTCTLLGLPWLTAAAIRTITHLNALKVPNQRTRPDERPADGEIKEQRITAFIVSLLLGLSVVLGTVLQQIPLAVLFGIFFYMGVTSLSGVQLFQRALLLFTPAKYHPDFPFTSKVKTIRMHMFTVAQALFVAILTGMSFSPAAIAFPLVLILTIPARWLILPRFYSSHELEALDGEDMGLTFDEDAEQQH
uniref:anion exchange protein 2-like n=2 Tax=Myxine glutinosa TaxID=7769 RepID=UPI00358F679F